MYPRTFLVAIVAGAGLGAALPAGRGTAAALPRLALSPHTPSPAVEQSQFILCSVFLVHIGWGRLRLLAEPLPQNSGSWNGIMSTARKAWDFRQNAGQNGGGTVPQGIFLQKHATKTCFPPQLSLSLPVRHGCNQQHRRRVSIREFDCTQAHLMVSTCVVE